MALQVFFELGLTNILTQYVAYETAQLKWNDNSKLIGPSLNLSRLSHLLHFSVIWYSIIAGIFLLFLILGGSLYFVKYGSKDVTVSWVYPWLLVSISASLNLFSAPFLAILTGLDKVKEVAKIRFYQQITIPLFLWLGLSLNWGLYVLGISHLLSFIMLLIWFLITPMFKIFKNIWKEVIIEKVSYIREIFPYQWKIAVSWISGYFVLQLFNPVLFASEGAIVAGQMGMSLVAFNAIAAFSQSWINTKVPIMTKMIARKEYDELDSLFKKTLRQLSKVFLLLMLCFFGFLFLLRFFDLSVGQRFLPWTPLILMSIPLFVSQYVNSWATYLRCHKKEPLLLYSIVTGGLCCFSTLYLGTKFGVDGMTGGYCIIICLMSIWAHYIYTTKKVEWHKNSN